MGESHHWVLRKPGRAIWSGLALALIMVLFAPSTADASLFGQFAGYLRFGATRSVSAQWAVPEISSSSPVGDAATWIGAEAPGRLHANPFIQVGIWERARLATPTGPLVKRYFAFWSDTDRGFFPRSLFEVGADDRVVASLTLLRFRWRVHINDVTSGAARSFVTTQEGRAAFNLALWTQEDPTIGFSDQVPYPQLGLVAFQRLRVNGVAPTPHRLEQQWMSANHQTLSPTPINADAFQIQTVSPSPAVVAYARMANPLDAASERFVPRLERWTATTPRRRVVATCRRFAVAVRVMIDSLRSDPWPGSAERAIRTMIRRSATVRAQTLATARLAPRRRTRGRARIERDLAALRVAAARVRAELGVPRLLG